MPCYMMNTDRFFGSFLYSKRLNKPVVPCTVCTASPGTCEGQHEKRVTDRFDHVALQHLDRILARRCRSTNWRKCKVAHTYVSKSKRKLVFKSLLSKELTAAVDCASRQNLLQLSSRRMCKDVDAMSIVFGESDGRLAAVRVSSKSARCQHCRVTMTKHTQTHTEIYTQRQRAIYSIIATTDGNA